MHEFQLETNPCGPVWVRLELSCSPLPAKGRPFHMKTILIHAGPLRTTGSTVVSIVYKSKPKASTIETEAKYPIYISSPCLLAQVYVRFGQCFSDSCTVPPRVNCPLRWWEIAPWQFLNKGVSSLSTLATSLIKFRRPSQDYTNIPACESNKYRLF